MQRGIYCIFVISLHRMYNFSVRLLGVPLTVILISAAREAVRSNGCVPCEKGPVQ